MTILVVAAVVIEAGKVLVTQRPADSHFAGKWEFPGGKVEQDETPREALVRELREELAIDTIVGPPLEAIHHKYEDRDILLLFYHAERTSDARIQCRGVAAYAWRNADELRNADFPPADASILSRVRSLLGRTHFPKR